MSSQKTGGRLKVVHVSTVPYALYFLVPHFRALLRCGIEVDVVSANGDELEQLRQDENVNIYPVEMTRQITPLRDLFALVRLVALFHKLRPDIVHAHTPKGGLLGMLAAWLSGVPVRVYHVHGLPLETATGMKRMFLSWSDWLACRCAHQVYSVSASVREVVIQERLCSPDRIRVLNHGSISGIDAIEKFAPKLSSNPSRNNVRTRWGIGSDDLVVGFVGRLVRDKGLRELAESWQELREEFEQLHLLIAGAFEGEDLELALVRAQLEQDCRVHFVGMDRDTPPLYSAMDVIAFPTYREGLPCVPLEAAAMQLPVVASRVTGCVDLIVDHVTGTLVPPRDSLALTQALRRYLIDPELRSRHGAAARRHVLTHFKPDDIISAQFGEYDLLLSRHGKSFPAESIESSRAA